MSKNAVYDAAKEALLVRINKAFEDAGVTPESVCIEPDSQSWCSVEYFTEKSDLKVTIGRYGNKRCFKKLKSGDFNYSGMVKHVQDYQAKEKSERDAAERRNNAYTNAQQTKSRIILEMVPADKRSDGESPYIRSGKANLEVTAKGGLNFTFQYLTEEQARGLVKAALELGLV